jgi:inner membrane protein
MHSIGHFGLALGVMSIMMIPFGFGDNNLFFLIILLTAMLSALPDVDIKWGIAHRKFTHNILFAILTGILFGLMFGYSSGLLYGLVGFIGGFMGIMLHLLGDVMTHMAFKPFYPFSDKEYAWHWFLAKSEMANNGFFVLGVVLFFVYIMVSSGSLTSFL